MCLSVMSNEEFDDLTEQDLIQMVTDAISKQMDTGITFKMPVAAGEDGIFDTVDEAVAAAKVAQKELVKLTLKQRGELIEAIRKAATENAPRLARMELDETGMGRYEDKLAKHLLTINKTPGIEDIKPEICTGDDGMTIVERRPFGIAGCILPSTAPSCTAINNSICMIAAGNAAVISPHPGGKNTTLEAVKMINRAIVAAGGPANVAVSTKEATIELAGEIIHHPDIDILIATGGPGVVKAILSSGKKGIGAGPGNPPVVVDSTADIPKAAKCIIDGNSFENCLQCIGEKECFVVDSVADLLISEMQKNGAYLVRDRNAVDRITELVTKNGSPNKDYVGKDADIILRDAGIQAEPNVRTIIFEADADHIIVQDEYLMPLLPIVRVPDIDTAIREAVRAEGRRRHSSIIHSRDVHNITKFTQAIQTTITVKNGPSFAGVGLGGEGHVAMSLAGPTGEGVTSPRTFTRPQRCALIDDMSLRSAMLM